MSHSRKLIICRVCAKGKVPYKAGCCLDCYPNSPKAPRKNLVRFDGAPRRKGG